MDLKELKDTQSLVDDIEDFINNPKFNPTNQNKWFFSDGLSYYQQLCEILKTLTYFQESFKLVYENEQTLATAYKDVETLPDEFKALSTKVDTLAEQVSSEITRIETLESDNEQNKKDIVALQVDDGTMKSDITTLKADNTQNKNDIVSLKADNDTNKNNISNNATDIKALQDADFLKLVGFLNSENVSVVDHGKVDGKQTFTISVTGTTPVNLTKNVTYFNDNSTQPIATSCNMELDSTNNTIKMTLNNVSDGIGGSTESTIKLSTDEFKILNNQIMLAKDYLDATTAQSTYLSQADASETYTTKTEASNTYATKTDLTAETTARTSIDTQLQNSLATKANTEDVANTYATKASVDQELEDLTTTFNNAIASKQDKLVSGTNIKSINGSSVLGSGDLEIEALPTGGVKGNLLYKKSATDGDVGWTGITTDNLLTQDNIVNNLTSSSTTNALGASQGKVLNDKFSITKYSDITVSVTPTALSSYQTWDTANAYGYSADIAINGITENSLIQNIIMTDTLLSAIAPVITTGANKLTIYTSSTDALSGTIISLYTQEV